MDIKKLLTKKNALSTITVIAILVAGYFLFFNKKDIQKTLTLHRAEFLQQVSASGTVVARENLDLSFAGSDQVFSVNVKVGDIVRAGQLLASQTTGELQAQYLQMKAGVDLAKAKLEQLLAGNSPQEIQVAQGAVMAAEQNLDNAYADSLNDLNNAEISAYNALTAVTLLKNSYFYDNDQQGLKVQDGKKVITDSLQNIKISIANAKNSNQNTDAAMPLVIANLHSIFDSLAIIRQQCEEGIYANRVSATDKATLDTHKDTINDSLTAITLAQSDIASDKVSLTQAQDALVLKKAPIRASDIAVYQAQITQAEASLQEVSSRLAKKVIYSPINGIVTVVNAKVGSIFSSAEVAVSIISKNNFQVESFVPQINISLLSAGQAAKVTLDSYGETVFDAKIVSIAPAETIKDGVSTYKVTLAFTNANDSRVKSGMTGNVVITTLQKENVISVPQGIVTARDGQKFVQIKNGEVITELKVETGAVASNGNIEILSGLKDDDIVVVK